MLPDRLERIAADPRIGRVEIQVTPMTRGLFHRFGLVESRRAANGFAPGYDLVEVA